MKERGIIAVKLHCQPPEAEKAWKRMGFQEFPDAPDFDQLNNIDAGRYLYQIIIPNAQPDHSIHSMISGESLELWAVQSYLSNDQPPRWKWNLEFEQKSRKLTLPIIFPSSHKWHLCWKAKGEIVKSVEIKNFTRSEIHFDLFLYLTQLP